MSAHRLAPLAAGLGVLVALAAASPAVAGTPGRTIRIINQTEDVLGNGSPFTGFGTFSVTPPPTLTTTSPGNVGTAVAATDSQGRFLGDRYGPDSRSADHRGGRRPPGPIRGELHLAESVWTCSVKNATSTTPWVVNLLAEANDRTPPAVRVRAPASLAEESLRKPGLPVGVRSNEPGRARIKLIARAARAMRRSPERCGGAGRDYRVKLRLNAAGRRAVQIFDVYTLRIRVGDRAGNRRTVQRRIVIR